MKKFVALCLLVTMLTGCSSIPAISGSVNGPSVYEGIVFNVNDHKISAAEAYVYIYLMQMSAGAIEEKQLLDNVQEQILEIEILSQRASESGRSLGEDEKQQVDLLADQAFASMDSMAEEYGITGELVRHIYEKSQLAGNYYNEITADYGITVAAEEAQSYHAMTIQQLFIASEDTSRLENGQTAEQLAADIKARAEAGEDFKTLARYYSSEGSCQTMDLDSEGYMLDSGDLLNADFVSEVWKLKTGDISAVIHIGDGCYVVKCIDVDSDTLREKMSDHRLKQKQRERFEKDYEIWQQETVYAKESGWKKLHIIE